MLGFLLAVGIGTALVWAISSSPSPKPNTGGTPPPAGPTVIEFDLQSNWGVIPADVRRYAALAERASGTPGLARALAVHWWSVWRGAEPIVHPDVAAKLAQENPALGLKAFTPDPAAAEQLTDLVQQGYPKPSWPDGWAQGRYGLGGVLGSTAVYAGSESARVNNAWQRSRLPLIGFQADPTMYQGHVQAWLGAVLAARALVSPTVIGADATNTWGNVFSYVTDPNASEADALAAKVRFIERAAEAGINLNVAPIAAVTKPTPAWQLWNTVQAFRELPLIDNGVSLPPVIPPKEPPKQPAPPVPVPVPPPAPTEPLPISLGEGLSAMQLPTAVPLGTAAPMVVVLHGRGADVGQLVAMVPPTPSARVFLLRAPSKVGNGFQFFPDDLDNPQVGGAIVNAARSVMVAIRQLLATAPTTKIVIVGHEQGAAIALRLAMLGFADVALASGGYLPASLVPQRPTQSTVVFVSGATHVTKATPTIDAFKTAGFLVYANTIAGAGSSLADLTVPTRDELNATLAQLPPPAAGGFDFDAGCKLVITDVGQTMRYLFPRVLSVAGGMPIAPTALRKVVHDSMTVNDQACVFVPQIKPADPAAAVRSYLLSRQLVTTLLLRAQLDFIPEDLSDEEKAKAQALPQDVKDQKAKDLAVAMVNNALNEAIAAGAPAGELPQLGV